MWPCLFNFRDLPPLRCHFFVGGFVPKQAAWQRCSDEQAFDEVLHKSQKYWTLYSNAL